MFKVIIAGGRDFNDYNFLKQVCSKILSKKSNIEIVSGTAPGADSLGEKLAIEMNLGLKSFPAPWQDIQGKPKSAIGTRADGSKYWKRAGIVRNQQMADYADALIAFHDGVSRGTSHMISAATKKGMPVRVNKYVNNGK